MIVGFHGRAGAGKDTAAQPFIKLGFMKVAFATEMKMGLNAMFGWELENWDDLEWKEAPQFELFGKSPRQVAQTLGTEWGRNLVHEDIWAETAMRHARMYENAVFTDVRFPNEARIIRKNNGLVIRVTRDGDTSAGDHDSEQVLGPELVDYVLNASSGAIGALQAHAMEAIRKLAAKKGLK